MVVCVYLPRFELVVSAGGPQALSGRPVAVAPTVRADSSAAGRLVGEVSGAAEARGVRRGMALGEALARCPDLELVPADPVRVGEEWEGALCALESIGAAVEGAQPGLAYFQTDGLLGLHGTPAGAIAAARGALGRPARIGAGPTRLCALAAAMAVRSRRPLVLEGEQARRWLSGRPVELLGFREETAVLIEPLGRLGIRTLGDLARLGRPALADRFGAAGVLAHRLACAKDGPVRPRRVPERLLESMDVGDASSGPALRRVMGVLVGRLLARPERRGRTLRALSLSADLLAGGGWRERVVFREAMSDPERISLALSAPLLTLPAPAAALSLAVERFGPAASEQGALGDQDRAARAARLREAIVQTRTLAGRDAALRAVCVDPDSRVPERRVVLAPMPGE